MSAEHVGWAFRQDTGSPTRKLVLVALADRCNKDSLQCNPHIETLAADCNLNERSVRRALADLVKDGLLTRTRNRRSDGALAGYSYGFPDLSPPADTESARDAVLPDTGAAGLPVTESGLEGNREVLNREGTTGTENLPAAAPPYDPLKGLRFDGQDLPWNALSDAVGGSTKIEGSRMKRALESIRIDLWDWVQERGPQAALFARSDARTYEEWAARSITEVTRALRENAPTLTWGPEGFARNFRRGIALIEERVDVDAIVAEKRGRAA